MACLCRQPDTLDKVPRYQRWFVFAIGMVETMLWSGVIFGWASLVHVLKLQGVYSNLCLLQDIFPPDGNNNNNNNNNSSSGVLSFADEEEILLPASGNGTYVTCAAQDERFALLYTVACVVYSTPGILVGYALHHLGLAFTRIMGGLMVCSGFLLLSLTSPGAPDYLWGATILLSVGGNTVRMSGLQFANLFPSARNTAMAIISGIFTPSAGVLMVVQTMYESGLTWHYCCWVFAAASSLVVIVTPLVPRHHIPFTQHHQEKEAEASAAAGGEEGNAGEKDTIRKYKEEPSVQSSVLSLSSFLHAYWLFINLFGVTLFATHFNSWINRFATSTEETSRYSKVYGYANILCVFVTPIPGLTMDFLSHRFRGGKTGLQAEVASLQAMILPMVVVSCTVLTQTSMMLFRAPWAVYVGLAALTINRPSCLAIGNPFVRARFPAEHFNRLIGIQGTALSLLTFLQYPHFTWAQDNYYLTFGVTLGVMLLSLIHPLHLLSSKYLGRVLTPYTPEEAL